MLVPLVRPSLLIQTLALGDVLQRLAVLSPTDLAAIETLARDALLRRWPTPIIRRE